MQTLVSPKFNDQLMSPTNISPDQILHLLLLPVVGAFIGWITNYLAVKMLFHPRRKFVVLGFPIQGVFPQKQHEFARKMGELVAKELFSVEDVTNRLASLATSPENLDGLRKRIEAIAHRRLSEEFPALSIFLKASHVSHVVTYCLPDIRQLIIQNTDMLTKKLHRELDVHRIVEEKVASFSSAKLEEIVFSIMKKEFRSIEIVGGVLGFVIGLAQALLSLFSII